MAVSLNTYQTATTPLPSDDESDLSSTHSVTGMEGEHHQREVAQVQQNNLIVKIVKNVFLVLGGMLMLAAFSTLALASLPITIPLLATGGACLLIGGVAGCILHRRTPQMN